MTVYLAGDESTDHGSSIDKDLLLLSKFTCAVGGSCTQLGVYHRTDAGGGEHVKVCLYADNGSGEPGVYLRDTGEQHGATGWNYYEITPIDLVVGTVYWLGWNDATGYRFCRHTVMGVTRYKTLTYGNAFPDPAGTGFTSNTTWVTQAVAYGTATATGCPRQSMYLACMRNE